MVASAFHFLPFNRRKKRPASQASKAPFYTSNSRALAFGRSFHFGSEVDFFFLDTFADNQTLESDDFSTGRF